MKSIILVRIFFLRLPLYFQNDDGQDVIQESRIFLSETFMSVLRRTRTWLILLLVTCQT